jgi:hypothetical protein
MECESWRNHELCRLDLSAGSRVPVGGSVLSNFRTAHSQAADPTQNVLSMVATCCYLSCYFAQIWLGAARRQRPTARSKKSTWFQTAIPIIMSSACHAQKKASGVKMVENLVLQRKWLSQVLQRWPIATWGLKCLPPSPQNCWHFLTHTLPHVPYTATPNNKKEQLKTLEWGKKNHMYHPVN